jgi:cation diffusion facilitator CzcD-associated flavoprotein CzcO
MTEFTDFPMDDDVAEYPSHHQMKRYFRAFADHYNLRDHYHFNAEVLRCTPLGEDGDGWRVRWRDPQGEHEADFAGIMIANGTLSEPNMPDFKSAFTGTLIHAAQYKSATQFAGKRVLIVGAGNSG